MLERTTRMKASARIVLSGAIIYGFGDITPGSDGKSLGSVLVVAGGGLFVLDWLTTLWDERRLRKPSAPGFPVVTGRPEDARGTGK